jgi:hydrogenase nickel incorporation protein HypB
MHDIAIHSNILADNESLANVNREVFTSHGVYVVNLMSAPGSGKTSILEKTIQAIGDKFRIGVIEGDVQGHQDAERIERLQIPVIQINTGGACHLDAKQIQENLRAFNLHDLDLLIIENVGNLVCPAEFDLGEHDKVMVLSITEGHDKPRKYPVMFHTARAMLLNKIDLLPHTDFDVQKATHDARALHLDLEIFQISARTGEGISQWVDWLTGRIQKTKDSVLY